MLPFFELFEDKIELSLVDKANVITKSFFRMIICQELCQTLSKVTLVRTVVDFGSWRIVWLSSH